MAGALLLTNAAQAEDVCSVVKRALSVAEGRQRHDLAMPKDGYAACQRPAAEGCPYIVELEYELLKADRADLAARLDKALDVPHCDSELRFAMQHGLPAYRDMLTMRHDAVSEWCAPFMPR